MIRESTLLVYEYSRILEVNSKYGNTESQQKFNLCVQSPSSLLSTFYCIYLSILT